MKNLQIYNFSMTSGGSFQLPVSGSYVRVLTATGNVNIIADTWGKLGPISRGQGLEDSPYNRLTIQDASGAGNSGTILVSEANFIDQTLYGSISISAPINVRPESYTTSTSASASLAANTAEQVLAPGANINGVIVKSALFSVLGVGAQCPHFSLLAKSSAPTTVIDGVRIMGNDTASYETTNTRYIAHGSLINEILVPAGLGLYWITDMVTTVGDPRSTILKVL